MLPQAINHFDGHARSSLKQIARFLFPKSSHFDRLELYTPNHTVYVELCHVYAVYLSS